jgi:hypothetical protein
MALFSTNPPSLIASNAQSAGSAKSHAAKLAADSRGLDSQVTRLFQAAGSAATTLQEQVDAILRVLRGPIPQPDAYSVADPTGHLIAWIGYRIVNNVVYDGGWFQTLYVGGADPTQAFLVAGENSLSIENAIISLSSATGTIVLDPTVPSIVSTDTATGISATMQPGVFTAAGAGGLPNSGMGGGLIFITAGSPGPTLSLDYQSVTLLNPSGQMVVDISAPIGTGTITLKNNGLTQTISLDPANGINVTTVYKVAGNQVVGARLAAIPSASVSTTTVAQTAGATYTANEQNMLASLKAAVNQLNTDVDNLKATQDIQNLRLFTHGLTS